MWLIIDFFVYYILGIYLENVLPQTNGVRKPFYYFLTPQYWCPKLFIKKGSQDNNEIRDQEEELKLNLNYEKVPDHCLKLEADHNFLKINNLRKTFGGFVAVHNLNLNMYQG